MLLTVRTAWRRVGAGVLALGLAACDRVADVPPPRTLSVGEMHQLIQSASKGKRVDVGWATDMQRAFLRLDVPATRANVCSAIAVVAQESGFVADPPVTGLADITLKKLQSASQNPAAYAAINIRLRQTAANGRSFYDNLLGVRTERDLERWYQAFTAAHMTAGLLKLAGKDVDTLISTLGSMQVSARFARAFAEAHDLPAQDIREQLYTRAGGLFYGMAHLLKVESHYADRAHLFADYNAGHFASRNAGFQRMLAKISGIEVVPDGDLLTYPSGTKPQPSLTYRVVLAALGQYGRAADPNTVFADLSREKGADFIRTATYRTIAELHQQRTGHVITEAMPQIDLHSDKISRRLTTEWFARRVASRYTQCLRATL